MKAVESILDLVGKTPMIRLDFPEVDATILAKLEFLNPTGSVKDRIAKYMIERTEERGELKPSYKIVEATSGNTGIAFSLVAAAKRYKMVAVMPEIASVERKTIIKHYGAEVILTPAKDFVEGSVRKARELAKQPSHWMPAQFENYDNVAAHREITGKETIEQTGGKVDAFVAGINTGGTLMGVAEALKVVNPEVKIIAVEPSGPRSEAKKMTEHTSITKHKIEGIGDGSTPSIVKLDVINE